MQSLNILGRNLSELAEAERCVPKISALIERQRELVEELEREGHDLTSAMIVLDSLFVSLSLYVQNRHALRTLLGVKVAEARAA